ncbi:hypothetical protein ACP4OV_011903 [Aristida adscensionis]
MGFNLPVPQRDSDWEIRVAVLLSLLLQVLLIFLGPMRKRTSWWLPLFAIWSCYLLADWVADLALGLLVNNLGNIGGNNAATSAANSSSSPGIFAFWTPFLLLHLGGPDTVTAYSIEDNELWLRHLIGLLFQLFAAGVVFSSSLQGNPMIPATVLMFVAGIIKYGERTYSLYSSSVDGVLANILPPANPGFNYAKLMSVFSSKERAGLIVEVVAANGIAVESARTRERNELRQRVTGVRGRGKSLEAQAHDLFVIFRSVCYDANLGQRERKMSQAYFLDYKDTRARKVFEVIEVELNFVFDMVHTKEPVAHTVAGCVLRFIASSCIVSSAVLFHRQDKKGSIGRVDVGITYALALGAVALDAAALAMLVFSDWTLVLLEEYSLRVRDGGRAVRRRLVSWIVEAVSSVRPRQRRWSEMTSQLNLISYCLGKHDGGEGSTTVGHWLWRYPWAVEALAKVAGVLRVTDKFDDLFFVKRVPLTRGTTSRQPEGTELLEFIFDELKATATAVRRSTYQEQRNACSYRGERVLRDIHLKGDIVTEKPATSPPGGGGGGGGQPQPREIVEADDRDRKEDRDRVLMDSVNKWDFDESLLMWHIATDLLLLGDRAGAAAGEVDDGIKKRRSVSKRLSEYMLYLLVKQPKIMAASAGVGHAAYGDTCAEAQRFFASAHDRARSDQQLARRMLLGTNTSIDPVVVKGGRSRSVLFHGCILAKKLLELDKGQMWKVVALVWLEMLTYAAGKCKGTTHVSQLARGGELITMVWLLMAHMGIGDIYQKEVEEDARPKIIVHGQ